MPRLIPLALIRRRAGDAQGGLSRCDDWLVAPLWVAAACISIAVNGSRGLPQYFVQAAPALALAAGWAGAEGWRRLRGLPTRRAALAGLLATAIVATAMWRVNQFPKLVEQTTFDASYMLGRIGRTDIPGAVRGRSKVSRHWPPTSSPDRIRELTTSSDRVYVFGFTCAAYVDAGRASASRFFWSRPVIAGFKQGTPGYGSDGLLDDLERHAPRIVALQRKDWAPDVTDSADFFLGTPSLAGWLRSNYERTSGPEAFDVWVRKAGRS